MDLIGMYGNTQTSSTLIWWSIWFIFTFWITSSILFIDLIYFYYKMFNRNFFWSITNKLIYSRYSTQFVNLCFVSLKDYSVQANHWHHSCLKSGHKLHLEILKNHNKSAFYLYKSPLMTRCIEMAGHSYRLEIKIESS